MKRLIAGLCALLVSMGGGVALADSAAAWTKPSVAGSQACDTGTGKVTVTWTVTNNETGFNGYTARIFASDRDAVPVGTVIPGGQSKTFTETVAPGETVTLNIKLRWTKGQTLGDTKSASGTLTATSECFVDTSGGTIQVCHSGNGKHYELIEPDKASFYSGHRLHEDDIYPAGSYSDGTHEFSWDAQGDQALLASGCEPPKVDCTTKYDFPDQKMWEVTWGHGFADRNGGAPTFTMQSNGGLVALDGKPVPSYMTADWKWLYITDGKNADHTYTFADGTVRTVKVTFGEDSDGCSVPTIVWDTIPFVPFIETSATVDCGTATITLHNHSAWIYPVSYRIDGGEWKYGPVVDNRGEAPNDQSGSKTFTFAEDSGVHTIEYVVNAGTESDLYRGKPVGEVRTLTVESDCAPPETPQPKVEVTHTEWVDGTQDCDATTVEQTRTATVTTTPFVVVGEAGDWQVVEDTENVTVETTTETRTRTLEESEIKPCPVEKPEPPVVTPPAEKPPVVTPPVQQAGTATVAELPYTGARPLPLLVIAGLLLSVGLGVRRLARR